MSDSLSLSLSLSLSRHAALSRSSALTGDLSLSFKFAIGQYLDKILDLHVDWRPNSDALRSRHITQGYRYTNHTNPAKGVAVNCSAARAPRGSAVHKLRD